MRTVRATPGLVACLLAVALAHGGEVLVIGDFEEDDRQTGFSLGQEFRGAKGRFGVAPGGYGGTQAARIEADFRGGGQYVALSRPIDTDRGFLALRFWVKSDQATGLAVRVVDRTGQCHQQSVRLEPGGTWQEVRITRFDQGSHYVSWGGAKDRQWHPPAKGLSILVEKNRLKAIAATVLIDDIVADLDPAPVIPQFRVAPVTLGNIFLKGEPVRLPVRTKADRLDYAITDFYNTIVEAGSVEVKEHQATVEPALPGLGHFVASMELRAGGKLMAKKELHFAVIEPIDFGSVRNSPFGVCTHFSTGWKTDLIPLLVRAGIPSVRDEVPWDRVEANKGTYTFDRFDAYLKELAQHGIDPLLIMCFANKHHDQGLTPHTPAGCEAYARYGQEILKHYGEQIKWIEVWNEYNGTWCKGPAAKARSQYYAQMIRHAFPRLKEIRPDVVVLGCGTVLAPLPYLGGIFKHGGLEHMDRVVIHPYRGKPEGVERDLAELNELIAKYNDGRPKKVWATEYGTQEKGDRQWSAQYHVRLGALMLSQGVERMYKYLLKDTRDFPNMGLLPVELDERGPYSPTPSYVAMAVMIRQLHDAVFQAREAASRYSRAYVLRFDKPGQGPLRVAWARYPQDVRLHTQSALTVTDIMGNARTYSPKEGLVLLTLDETPVYVAGAVDQVGEVPSRKAVLTDSGG